MNPTQQRPLSSHLEIANGRPYQFSRDGLCGPLTGQALAREGHQQGITHNAREE
jgi:hypothetical protein